MCPRGSWCIRMRGTCLLTRLTGRTYWSGPPNGLPVTCRPRPRPGPRPGPKPEAAPHSGQAESMKKREGHFAWLPAGDHPALIHFSLEFRERISSTGCMVEWVFGSRSFERFSPGPDQPEQVDEPL